MTQAIRPPAIPGRFSLVLTAQHVADALQLSGTYFEFLQYRVDNQCVAPMSGGIGEGRGPRLYGATVRAFGADFALLELVDSPDPAWGTLHIDHNVPAVGDPIYIPNYGELKPQRYGVLDSELASGEALLRSISEPSPCGSSPDFGPALGYSLDVLPGSSGSPVLNRLRHRVVGINYCGPACPALQKAVPVSVFHPGIWSFLPAIPAAIDSVRVAKAGDPAVDLLLSWQAQVDAASYRVYRGTVGVAAPGSYDHVVSEPLGIGDCSVVGTSRTFSLAAAEPGDFYYLVVGVNACGDEGDLGEAPREGFNRPFLPIPAGPGCP